MFGSRQHLTAGELFKRYAAGERTFRGVNLSGQKLRGAVLSDIDISDSDLRSTDLREANLTRANLTGCRMGRTMHWTIFYLLLLMTIAAFLGLSEYYLIHINKNQSALLDFAQWLAIPILCIIYLVFCFPIRIMIAVSISLIPSFIVLSVFLEGSHSAKLIIAIASASFLITIWIAWRFVARKSGRNRSL